MCSSLSVELALGGRRINPLSSYHTSWVLGKFFVLRLEVVVMSQKTFRQKRKFDHCDLQQVSDASAASPLLP